MGNNGVNPNHRPANFNTLQNMKAYDRLPKTVRKALQESENNWSAAGILYGMRRKKIKAAEVVKIIRQRDVESRCMPQA